MGRTLGIDFGDRRVGLALGDPSGIIASAHSMIERTSDEQVVAEVLALCETMKVDRIVMGLPLNMDGTRGSAVQKVEQFAGKIRANCAIRMDFWDERMSTISAQHHLIETGAKKGRRRQMIDKMAAQVILQHYLDAQALQQEWTSERE